MAIRSRDAEECPAVSLAYLTIGSPSRLEQRCDSVFFEKLSYHVHKTNSEKVKYHAKLN